ncbi:PTS transporter subunit EIIC [Mycoplasmopsis caviae]|uniref:PTS transporter subunit EIIC n=1 Tax=Mycoplasmopsis caviae TaxID=55603 RepID=A0A3P8L6T0_9BACT|nr:PTS transporter subunit EIIC [Mycoplasmopsis caviae]UUD35488.1 PTS transporter subunit EIIC [Mycoplasmopsis caviae]VDR41735.1 phosphotransferase permease, EIIB domain-containing protein [Mycoplasmopsis caviae]
MSTTKSKVKDSTRPSFGKRLLERLGRIGRVLMFPIAVLPIAAILLRIGADLPTISQATALQYNISYSTAQFINFVAQMITAGGSVVFDNLPILFAVGIGFGFSKDNRGEAAFAALIGMLLLMLLMNKGAYVDKIYDSFTFKNAEFNAQGQKIGAFILGAKPGETFVYATGFAGIFGSKYNAILSGNVLNGIIVGFIVAAIYNHTNSVQLPKVLGFFSGRRLIPALAILTTLIWGIAYALIFPWVGYLIYLVSVALTKGAQSGRWGTAAIMGIYGVLNRLLIPFGLHHIPNNLFWFQLGEHVTPDGSLVFGDIFIFLSGKAKGNHAGIFQAGFFPVMMFGLPALAFAFYKTADNKVQKQRVLAIFGAAAVVSILSGITEPIEFAFMFVSPLLYGFHCLLTGIFAFITGAFGIQIGFGFSAGLMDYLLSIPKSLEIIKANKSGADAVMANPGWILVIGAACALSYYFVAYFTIKGLKLETPGRGSNQLPDPNALAANQKVSDAEVKVDDKLANLSPKAKAIVEAIGGYENITSFSNCTTRLRYEVRDADIIDEAKLKLAGCSGLIKLSKTSVQIIIGVEAESLNGEIESGKGAQ